MKTPKSVGVSVVLTFFFNFFGLIYSSWIGFLVVGSLSISLFLLLFGHLGEAFDSQMASATSSAEEVGTAIGAGVAGIFAWSVWWFVSWILSLIFGVVTTQRHNRKALEEQNLAAEARHQETLAALNRRGEKT